MSDGQPRVSHIDHLVLTVRDIPRTVAFYEKILGMRAVTYQGDRTALAFGNQKINLHQKGAEYTPNATHPKPGSADLCFIVHGELQDFIYHLKSHSIKIIEGPVERTGAEGPIRSVYIRDPDHNLIELAVPAT